MQNIPQTYRRLISPAILVVLATAVAGCGAPEPYFHLNRVYLDKKTGQKQVAVNDRQKEIAGVLRGLFGTPDDPHLPDFDTELFAGVVDGQKLTMSAGSVASDENGNPRGLYREHCGHCHGITGDGNGPTAAFLNPHPRDYRMGVFKFKSTPKGERPTHEDLQRILLNGVPGTAMPSFALLPKDQVDSLTHYVKYLAIRGQVERGLIEEIALELEPGDPFFNEKLKKDNPETYQERVELIKTVVSNVVSRWQSASDEVTQIAERQNPPVTAEEKLASINHGRGIFFGAGGCVKCHGAMAMGNGVTTDYDDWGKELDVESSDKDNLNFYVNSYHALKPRPIIPRNLRSGVYRGGRRPLDLHLRIRNGIDGTPMPGATKKDPSDPKSEGLTDDDIWSLIDYVRSLPYEEISQPPAKTETNTRERAS